MFFSRKPEIMIIPYSKKVDIRKEVGKMIFCKLYIVSFSQPRHFFLQVNYIISFRSEIDIITQENKHIRGLLFDNTPDGLFMLQFSSYTAARCKSDFHLLMCLIKELNYLSRSILYILNKIELIISAVLIG